ncbi:ABC transporter permease subunit [Mycoplasmopsis gallinarum]|uniref:Oligopeptide transport system permease protein OppC n=1 Tax=Mycoplasmopsis gallinarum TaxID=29557 RepID=A0A168RH82_9BACT|nr:ABC transporter permease subunit [Mycoplasmopsis gallinarum]OAB48984.1 Oligopeptide transport system permease protein OppC [Mycoplasmopsis gallinarum]
MERLKFAKSHEIISPTVPTNSFKSFLHRFFSKKINILIFAVLILLLLFLILSVLFYPYRPNEEVKDSPLFYNLPNYFDPLALKKVEVDSPFASLLRDWNEIDSKIIIQEKTAGDKLIFYYNPYRLLNVIYGKEFILFFGTDNYGISRFSFLINSLVITLFLTFIICITQMLIGAFLGTYLGYYQEKNWAKISYFTFGLFNILPYVFLNLFIFKLLGFSYLNFYLVVSLLGWINFFYSSYSVTQEIKNNEYINAYKVSGFSNQRIIWKIIIPQILWKNLSIFAENISLTLLVACSLSFFKIDNLNSFLTLGNVFKKILDDFSNIPYLIFVTAFTTLIIVLFKFLSVNLYLATIVKN